MDNDTSATNEIQTLSIVDNTIFLTNGGSVDLPETTVTDNDTSATNELQVISISNDTVYLSEGGSFMLPEVSTADNDTSATNELQVISISNDTIYLSEGGSVVLPEVNAADNDTSATNELQTISISIDTIYLSDGGIAELPEVSSADNDTSATNELQVISISNDTVYLSDGGFAVLPNQLPEVNILTGTTTDLRASQSYIYVGNVQPTFRLPDAALHSGEKIEIMLTNTSLLVSINTSLNNTSVYSVNDGGVTVAANPTLDLSSNFLSTIHFISNGTSWYGFGFLEN